jgi:hypothetical protein
MNPATDEHPAVTDEHPTAMSTDEHPTANKKRPNLKFNGNDITT